MNIRELMVIEIDEARFEKHIDGDTVNIYSVETGEEFDMFTDYNIGNDTELFKKSCVQTYQEWLEEVNR